MCPSISYYIPSFPHNPYFLLPPVSLHFLLQPPLSESLLLTPIGLYPFPNISPSLKILLFTPTCVKQCIPPFPTTYPPPSGSLLLNPTCFGSFPTTSPFSQNPSYLPPPVSLHFLLHPSPFFFQNPYYLTPTCAKHIT